MSENVQAQAGDQSTVQSEQVEQVVEQTEIVSARSAEELGKRLKEVSEEAKRYRQRLAEEKKLREVAEKKALQDSGNWQELAKRSQDEADAAKGRADKLKQAFAYKTVTDKVALEASKAGCIDSDLLVSVLPIDSIVVDEDFNVDMSAMKTLIDDMKRSKPYLFKKEAPKIADVAPGKAFAPASVKPLDKMNSQEIEQLLMEKYKK